MIVQPCLSNSFIFVFLLTHPKNALGFSSTPFCSRQRQGRPPTTSNFASSSLFEGTLVACTGPMCTRNDRKKVLSYFQKLTSSQQSDEVCSRDKKVTIETVKCVSECAECASGPNVEVQEKNDTGPFHPIKNKMKSKDNVKAILRME